MDWMTASLQSGKSRLKIPDMLKINLENISQSRMTMELGYMGRKKVCFCLLNCVKDLHFDIMDWMPITYNWDFCRWNQSEKSRLKWMSSQNIAGCSLYLT